MSYRSVDLATSGITVASEGGTQEFKYADDFALTPPVDMNVAGDLVFVGYGISSPRNNFDDYGAIDVKGKIAFAAAGVPDSLKGAKLGDKERGEQAALAHGAAGFISVAPPQFLIAWGQVKRFLQGNEVELPPRSNASGKTLAAISAGPALIKAVAAAIGAKESDLVSPEGKPLKPMALAATAEIRMKVDVRDAPPAQNVVAILDGSDARLKDQYVVISAHYDHLKTGDGGEVFNGADDDGSGTVAVLEMAQAFSIGPRPKRSILVVFHTGEELGLFGSEFNTDYEPVVPLEKLVANFNIDMIGRSRPAGDTDPLNKDLTDKDSLYIIGADRLSTELNTLSEQTNADTARMRLDYTYNDEAHPQRFYYRSDHYNYAKHGIPIIFYFTGVHRDYHKTTDDIDRIDFEKMERITRLVFSTGWRVANLDHRLVVDKGPSRRQPR